jgi:hypothetical protein
MCSDSRLRTLPEIWYSALAMCVHCSDYGAISWGFHPETGRCTHTGKLQQIAPLHFRRWCFVVLHVRNLSQS